MARRILITGASGFVGTHLRPALQARHPGAAIVGLGLPRLEPAVEAGGGARDAPQAGPIDADMLEADLLDHAAVDAAVAQVRPDLVVHLAAQSSVGRAQAGIEATWRINLAGTLHLALAVARHAPEATVLFASSSEVYGLAFAAGPVDERTVPQPVNAYARSKAAAERLLADVLPPGARLIVARPFNHTGPGQDEAFVLPSFARQIARIEAGRQEPCLRVGNLDAVRDFGDVGDVVGAYCALIDAAPRLPARLTVNIASGRASRLHDLLATLRAMARVPFDIAVDPARLRPSDVPVALGDAALLRRLTGWAPRIPIETTLAGLLDAARAAEA